MANFNVGNDAKLVNSRLKQALKRGVTGGQLKQSKGSGAAGSFRLGDKKPSAEKKTKAPKSKAGTIFFHHLTIEGGNKSHWLN